MLFSPTGNMQLNVNAAAAIALPNIPADAARAWIQADGGDARWRDDATNPTAAIGGGFLLVDGNVLVYEGDLAAVRVIGSKINVRYYR